MNTIGPSASQVTPPASSADLKRTQLQALLLRKMLDAQQVQTDQVANELQGKGQILDIRV